MNWLRYKFTKESEPELLEFLKVANNENNESLPLELKKIWEQLLPLDKDVLQTISAINSSVIDCIDITESDEEINLSSSVQNLKLDKNKCNIKSTEDLIEGVKELLETEETLAENVIKQFGQKYSPQQLEEMFVLFSKELNSECILRLLESILKCNCTERELVATYFSRYILISKIVHRDVFVKKLLNDLFNVIPDTVITDIVRMLNETVDTKQLITIRKHLDSLSENQKNQILAQFLTTFTGIEERHVASILSLITRHIDLNVLGSIIGILHSSAKEFANEKIYGKLVIEVLQVLGNNIIKFETQLKHIIDNHKSVYGSQMNKIFCDLLQDNRINMSFNITRI